MSGWIASRALSDAMTPSPCGCELERKAAKSTGESREIAARDAIPQQYKWRCPAAGHNPVESIEDLPIDAQIAHKAVEELVDAKLAPTCPVSCAQTKWVNDAVDAWLAWEKGQLVDVYGDPASVLLDAVKLVARSTNARQAWEIKYPEKKDK